MKTKFTKAGSSVAVIIPSAILKALNIKSKNFREYELDLRLNEDNKTIVLSNFYSANSDVDNILGDMGDENTNI